MNTSQILGGQDYTWKYISRYYRYLEVSEEILCSVCDCQTCFLGKDLAVGPGQGKCEARGRGDGVTFRSTREAVGFKVAGALLPPVLLAVGVRRRRRLHLGTGGAGDAGTGADRVSEARVCKSKHKTPSLIASQLMTS